MDNKLQSVQFISNNQNSIKKFIAGSISGLSILFTTYPLDVLNTRRAMLGICGVSLTHKPALRNLFSGFIWTLFGKKQIYNQFVFIRVYIIYYIIFYNRIYTI